MSEIGLFDKDSVTADLKRNRRKLHAIAELSGEEFQTQTYLVHELATYSLKAESFGTGLAVNVKGNTKKIVALRADMDALPIQETPKEFASHNLNAAHLCGHDGHMAILLSLAKRLSQIPASQRPTVRLLFQPSEEHGGGAQEMIERGVMDKVKLIFGLHLCPELSEGVVATRDGGMFAGTVDYRIDLCGEEGHMAQCGMKHSAMLAASKFVVDMQKLFETKYATCCMHGFGSLHCGAAHNVVSRTATLTGTFRFYDEAKKEAFFMELERELVKLTREYGVEHRFVPFGVYTPLINSPELTRIVMKIVGAEECEPKYTAEDFGEYLRYADGTFFWLGTKSEKFQAGLHSPEFDFDERALLKGVSTLTTLLDAIADGNIILE